MNTSKALRLEQRTQPGLTPTQPTVLPLKSFTAYYLGTIIRPRRTFAALLADDRRLRFGLLALSLNVVLYTLVYVFLWHGGGAPSSFTPWVVQMGQDRAGFYSFDWLERLAGADIHNADRIIPAWQHLAVGDLMRTYRYVERYEPLGWIVVSVEPERALVVRSVDSRWSWALVLDPVAVGTTRLIARTRDGMMPGLQAPLKFLVAEPAHCIMEIGVLRGIKARAERMAKSGVETPIA